jgi:hypothetical protein
MALLFGPDETPQDSFDLFSTMDYSPSSSGFSFGDAGMLLKGAGTAISMFGEYQQGQAQKEAFDFNATLEDFSAEATKVAGEQEQASIESGEESMLSTQRAITAKNNVTMSGSPLDAALVTASNFEMDKAVADYNNKIKVLQYQSKASQDRYYGQVAQNESRTKMASTLMSGIGSIVGMAALMA